MGAHDSQRFTIGWIDGPGSFDQGLEPDRDVPPPRVFEEQSGWQRCGALGLGRQDRGIEVEVRHCAEARGFLPIIVFVTRRDGLPCPGLPRTKQASERARESGPQFGEGVWPSPALPPIQVSSKARRMTASD